MRYPEHIVEQVRKQSDITEVIGDVVQLKKQGRGFVGLCPFHDDRRPSMHVNPDIGLFKCFSCGKGGNVITFMMEFHRLTFQEAVKQLALQAHISLPDNSETEAQSETRSRRESAFHALQEAALFYRRRLSTSEGLIASRYFAGRGFGAKLIEEFMLGYAPNAWDSLSVYLGKQGFSSETLEDAGLVARRGDGKTYDRFRGRVMFAIHDSSGRVAGFGARAINNDDQPKYLNSPQSAVYDKSRILYGLFHAKQQIRSDGCAILTEGYADTLTLHQSGFRNTVASSGTALAKEQLRLLARYCKQLIIVYDADTAGANASLRGLELAVEEGFEVRLARLPAGEDPDSFTRKSGSEAFRNRINDALPHMDYLIGYYRDKGGFATPRAQAESLRVLVELVAKTPDTLQHDALMLKIADSLRLGTRDLYRIYDELRKAKSESARRNKSQPPVGAQPKPISTAVVAHKINDFEIKNEASEQSLLPPLSNEEREVLRIALTAPNALRFIVEKIDLQPESMQTERGKRMLAICLRAFPVAESNPVGWLLNEAGLQEDDAAAIAGLVMRRETPSEKWSDFNVEIPAEDARRIMTDALNMLRLRKVEAALFEAKIILKEPTPDTDELAVLKAIKKLTEERSRLTQELGDQSQ